MSLFVWHEPLCQSVHDAKGKERDLSDQMCIIGTEQRLSGHFGAVLRNTSTEVSLVEPVL